MTVTTVCGPSLRKIPPVAVDFDGGIVLFRVSPKNILNPSILVKICVQGP